MASLTSEAYRRLWWGYAASTFGSAVANSALPMVAVLSLHASALQMSLLAAIPALFTGLVAFPLGPGIESRLKRPVMVAADVLTAAALVTVPVAAWLGALTLAQLFVVECVVGVAQTAFAAASGAHLKALVDGHDLLRANASFEQVTWTSLTVGPPVGGALVSLLGPTVTLLVDAASDVVSAVAVRGIHEPEPDPPHVERTHVLRDAVAGVRYLWGVPLLRALFCNATLFSAGLGCAMALESFFMLEVLGFEPWQLGIVLGVCSLGGLVGARLTPRLVGRFGERRVLLWSGVARTPWTALMALAPAHGPGVVVLTLLNAGLLVAAGVFNPMFATVRAVATRDDMMARVVLTWTVTRRLTQPLAVVAGGVLAAWLGTRWAIGLTGLLAVATIGLLPWRTEVP